MSVNEERGGEEERLEEEGRCVRGREGETVKLFEIVDHHLLTKVAAEGDS